MPIDPGLWCRNGGGCADGDSPDQVTDQMKQWRVSADIPGGFIWFYDDIEHCNKVTGYSTADYARAINVAIVPAAATASAI